MPGTHSGGHEVSRTEPVPPLAYSAHNARHHTIAKPQVNCRSQTPIVNTSTQQPASGVTLDRRLASAAAARQPPQQRSPSLEVECGHDLVKVALGGCGGELGVANKV
jgi:hypothetical protein